MNSNTRNLGSNSTAVGVTLIKCRSHVRSVATLDAWRPISWQRRFCSSGVFLLLTLRKSFTRWDRPAKARWDWPIRMEANIATTVKLFTVLYAEAERYGLRLRISCSAVVDKIEATRCSNHTVGSRSETWPRRKRKKLHSVENKRGKRWRIQWELQNRKR